MAGSEVAPAATRFLQGPAIVRLPPPSCGLTSRDSADGTFPHGPPGHLAAGGLRQGRCDAGDAPPRARAITGLGAFVCGSAAGYLPIYWIEPKQGGAAEEERHYLSAGQAPESHGLA